MSDLRINLELTGARTGSTCVLGKYQFVKGRTVVSGDGPKVASAVKFLGRIYAAFPVGSRELEVVRAKEKAAKGEVPNGDAQTDPAAAGGAAAEVPGGVPPAGASGEAAGDGPQPAAGAANPAEHGPVGYRHPDTRLREAILSLDKANDEHWTAEGKPRLDAITKQGGLANVTRRDVERVAPDACR